MDTEVLQIISLVVGCVSILLAVFAIAFNWGLFRRTDDLSREIHSRATRTEAMAESVRADVRRIIIPLLRLMRRDDQGESLESLRRLVVGMEATLHADSNETHDPQLLSQIVEKLGVVEKALSIYVSRSDDFLRQLGVISSGNRVGIPDMVLARSRKIVFRIDTDSGSVRFSLPEACRTIAMEFDLARDEDSKGHRQSHREFRTVVRSLQREGSTSIQEYAVEQFDVARGRINKWLYWQVDLSREDERPFTPGLYVLSYKLERLQG